MGMLFAATVFICGLTYMGKTHLRVRNEFVTYLFLRWGLAEFFWIWMSADHLFSTVMRWKRKLAFDDLRVTRLTPSEVAIGFLGPSLGFLLIANTIHCLVDALTPYGRGAGFRSAFVLFGNEFEDILVWRIGLALGFWFTSFATAAAACAWSFSVAMESGPKRIHSHWFGTLVRSGLVIGTIDFHGLLIGALLSSVVMMGIEILGGSIRDRQATVVGIALIIATFSSGVLKLSTLGRREWVRAVEAVENYVEPEDAAEVEETERRISEGRT